MSIYDKLTALNITLPPVAVPAAAYVPFVQTGNLIFISGHIAKKDGKPWVGQLGKDTDTETGKLAARAIAIDLMGTLHAACVAAGGDLNKVKRIVKLMTLSTPRPTSRSSTWSPTVRANCLAWSLVTRARMRAARLAWRRSRWVLAWRLS